MMQHTIITIGRQFGSGGHEVGNRLAERLDIPLYDHNLIRMAAEELRISREDAQKVDETVLGRFLSAYAASSPEYRVFVTSDESGKPLTDRVFEQQSAIIRKLAEGGPGIFVGRCADYILGDYSNCINTFIYAYKEDRVRRIISSPRSRLQTESRRQTGRGRFIMSQGPEESGEASRLTA